MPVCKLLFRERNRKPPGLGYYAVPAVGAINRRSSAPRMAKAIPVDSTIFAKRARHNGETSGAPRSRHAVLDDVLAGVRFDIHIGRFCMNMDTRMAE